MERSITDPKKFVDKFMSGEKRLTDTVIFCFSEAAETNLIVLADRYKGMVMYYRHNCGYNNTTWITVVQKDQGRNNFAVANPAPGASNIATLAEEMYAWGIRRFISMGPVGHTFVQAPALNIGDLVVPQEVFPYDAVALHYAPPDFVERYYDLVERHPRIGPTDAIISRLENIAARDNIKLKRVNVATMGALYRETSSFAREITRRGTEVVDQELSGLYSALHDKKDAQVASILWISDMYPANGENWALEFDGSKIPDAERRAVKLCVSAFLENGSVSGKSWPFPHSLGKGRIDKAKVAEEFGVYNPFNGTVYVKEGDSFKRTTNIFLRIGAYVGRFSHKGKR